MMPRAVVGAVALMGISIIPAHAAVMTFNDMPPLGGQDDRAWIENGITATSEGDIGAFNVPDTAHIDDSGTSYASSITFTMSRAFDAVSFDILPLDNLFCTTDGCGIPYDNIGLNGVRDGVVVAESAFYMGTSPFTFFFDQAFSDLDSLIIAALLPNESELGGECFDAPCAHFNIDNVALAPIPLPAPILLLLTGLGALGLGGYRPKRMPAGPASRCPAHLNVERVNSRHGIRYVPGPTLGHRGCYD